jgi:hypothetical protein
VRYHAHGERPRTPYASAAASRAMAGDTSDPATLDLRIPGLDHLDLEPGAYYLWMP